MKKLLLILLLTPMTAYCQNFEGTITYANTYKSNSTNVTNEQLSRMMGSQEEYSIKGNNYKSVVNGTYMQMQLYIGSENRSYTLTAASDTMYWEDYGINEDAATKYEIKKNAATIDGLFCDELIAHAPKSTTYVFYNRKYSVDPELFKRHTAGNWYYIISKTKSLPLKTVYETEQFTMTNTATKITPGKLSDKVFKIADRKKVAKARS